MVGSGSGGLISKKYLGKRHVKMQAKMSYFIEFQLWVKILSVSDVPKDGGTDGQTDTVNDRNRFANFIEFLVKCPIF